MKTFYYPAIFHPEETGFSVRVPDIDGCFSEGDNMEEAVEMAIDAIGLCLEGCASVPAASLPGAVHTAPGEFLVLIPFDPLAYKRKNDSRAVKKTLTIPSWLNAMAEEQHINFSSVLQNALKKQLNIQ